MPNKPVNANCSQCPYKNNPIVYPEYIDNPDVVILGNAPTVNDVNNDSLFSDSSGKIVKHAILQSLPTILNNQPVVKRIQYNNAVLCSKNTRDKHVHPNAIACCLPRLRDDLAKLDSSATLVPLGKIAINTLEHIYNYPLSKKVTDVRGTWLDAGKHKLLPTISPSYIFNKPDEYTPFYLDIKKAVNGYKEYPCNKPPKVHIPLNREELEGLLADIPTGSDVAVDIEGENLKWYLTEGQEHAYRVLQIGIAYKEDEAIIINHALIYGELLPNNHPHNDLQFFRDEAKLYPNYNETMFNGDVLYDCKTLLNFFFSRKDLIFIAHNGKFDSAFLRSIGINLRVDFDTMLAHYALDERTGTHGLKTLAKNYLGMFDYEGEYITKHLKKKSDLYSKVPLEDLALYCAWDNCITLTLAKLFKAELIEKELYNIPFMSLIMPSHHALLEAEYNGIPINKEHLLRWQKIIQTYLKDLKSIMVHTAEHLIEQSKQNNKYYNLLYKVRKSIDAKDRTYSSTVEKLLLNKTKFNPNSVSMVAFLLYDVIGIPVISEYGIKPRSTSKQAIIRLIEKYPKVADVPFIQYLQMNRRVTKIYNSYIVTLLDNIDINGYVHPTFNIHGTVMGRLSVNNPAMQTIPRPYADILGAIIKSSISAPKGKVLIDADFSQAELRVAGVLSNDAFLMSVYSEGRDLHSETARAFFGDGFNKEQRTFCKNYNFAGLYSPNDLAFLSQAKLPIDEATAMVAKRKKLMGGFIKWREDNFNKAKKYGRVINHFGRVIRYPIITSKNSNDVWKSCNHMLVSSVASDINLLAGIELVKMGINVVLLVHDSIIVEADESEAEYVKKLVHDTMLKVAVDNFPSIQWGVDSDIKKSWSSTPIILNTSGNQVNLTHLNIELDKLKEELNLSKLSLPLTINKDDYSGKHSKINLLLHMFNSIQLWEEDTLTV